MALPVSLLVRPKDLTGQTNGQLHPSLLAAIDGGEILHHLAARSWSAMRAAANSDGVSVRKGADAYRDYATQVRLFRSRYYPVKLWRVGARRWDNQWWVKLDGVAVAAIPGTSNHGWGLAVDVADSDQETDPVCLWLMRRAHEFGWSAEIQSEAWHWRAVHGDKIPPAVLAYEAAQAPPPLSTSAKDDDMLLGFYKLASRPEVFAVHTGGYKCWIPDGATFQAAQAIAALSGVDPSVRVVQDNAAMRALGPVLGPVPTGVDSWGAAV